MSISLLAAAEPSSLALGFSAVSIIIALGAVFVARRSMTIANKAFERGGYEISVELDTSVDDLKLDADHISRRTTLLILVRNHRMGKVQVSAFHGEVEGGEKYEIGVIGERMGYTFDGVSKQQWHAGSSEMYELPAPSVPTARIRVGAELGNGDIIWSDWAELDEKTAAAVVSPST